MKSQYDINLENGITEILRKHNLTIASLFLALPYGILICWPAYILLNDIYIEFFENQIPYFIYNIIAFIICWGPFALFHYSLHLWYSKSRCPKCGEEVGHSPRDYRIKQWKCQSCGLEITSSKWFKEKLTFRKVVYTPGNKKYNKSG